MSSEGQSNREAEKGEEAWGEFGEGDLLTQDKGL